MLVIDLSIVGLAVTVFTFLYFLMWCLLSIVHVVVRDRTYKTKKFNPHEPLVSVLLPCRDEEKVVAEAIRQCVNQSYRNLEVIVIAHNCRDKTYEVAKQFENEKVIVLKLETKDAGKGLGLNYGLDFAKGEIIVIFDADSTIRSNYVEKIVDAIYGGKYDLVQGKIVGGNPNYNRLCFLQHMENLIFLSFFWGGKHKLGLPSGLGGTGIAVRRSSLKKIGGFRNVLVEDFDLCLRAELHEMRLGFCKDAVVYDEKVPHYRMLLRQRSRWFAGHFQLIKEMIKTPKRLPSLLRKNPVDFFHMLSPLYNLCLWIGLIVGVAGFLVNSQLIFRNVLVLSFSLPVPVLIIQTLFLQGLFILVLKKECKTREEFKRCTINLPLFYVFTLHWLLVFWAGLFLRDWQNTKTEHGFRAS